MMLVQKFVKREYNFIKKKKKAPEVLVPRKCRDDVLASFQPPLLGFVMFNHTPFLQMVTSAFLAGALPDTPNRGR